MDPGNVVLMPSATMHVYYPDGVERARVNYKPTDRKNCFVMLSLGVMRKGEAPGAFAMRALQELGWTPPPEADLMAEGQP